MSEQPAEKTEAPSEAAQRFSQPVQAQRSESADETPAKRPQVKSTPVPAGKLVGVAVPIAVIAVVLAWLIRPLLALVVLGAVVLAAVGALLVRSAANRARGGGSSSPRPSLWSRRSGSHTVGETTRRRLFPVRSGAGPSGASSAGRSSSSRLFGAGRSSASKPTSTARQGAAGRLGSPRQGTATSTTPTGRKQPAAAGRSSTSTGRSRFASTTSKPGAGSSTTPAAAGKSASDKPGRSSGRRWFGFGKSKSTPAKSSPSSSTAAKRNATATPAKSASGASDATVKRPATSSRGSRWPFKSRQRSDRREAVEPRRDRSREDGKDRRSDRRQGRDRQRARDDRDRPSRRDRDGKNRENDKTRPDNGTTTSPIKGDSAGANQKNKTLKEGKAAKASGDQAATSITHKGGNKTAGPEGKAEGAFDAWQAYQKIERLVEEQRRIHGNLAPHQRRSNVTNLPHVASRPEQSKPAQHSEKYLEALAASVRKAGKAPGVSRQEGQDMFAEMIDTSTPETRETTTRDAADAARRSAAYHDEQADRFFAQANVLRNQVGMAGAANGMEREGMKARNTAENRRGYALAFDKVADDFAAERNKTAS